MEVWVVREGPYIWFITKDRQKALDYKEKYYMSDITVHPYIVV